MNKLNDDEIPSEIDFSTGKRGKFFKSGAASELPVYLESTVHAYLTLCAKNRGIDISALVNELLRKEIEITGAAR